jgi:hypothetical protein
VSDIEDTTADEAAPNTIDRRSALKKAAAAGAIAWTAPMVLSSTVSAVGNGTCTPKCAPGSFSPVFAARDACDGEEAALAPFIGTGNKIAILKVTGPSGLTCPCGVGVPDVVIGVPAFTEASKNNGAPTGCELYEDSPSNLSVIKYPGKDDELVAFKQGAIGDGWYTLNNPICVSIGCQDEIGGDYVYRKCNFNICFDYSPSKSICTLAETLETRSTAAGGCTIGCDPC